MSNDSDEQHSSIKYFLNTILRTNKLYTQAELKLLLHRISKVPGIIQTFKDLEFNEAIQLVNTEIESYGLKLNRGIIQYPRLNKKFESSVRSELVVDEDDKIIWALTNTKTEEKEQLPEISDYNNLEKYYLNYIIEQILSSGNLQCTLTDVLNAELSSFQSEIDHQQLNLTDHSQNNVTTQTVEIATKDRQCFIEKYVSSGYLNKKQKNDVILFLSEKTIVQLSDEIISLDKVNLCELCGLVVIKGLRCDQNHKNTKCNTYIHDLCFKSLSKRYHKEDPKCPTCVQKFTKTSFGPDV